jgi:hypothetical protein
MADAQEWEQRKQDNAHVAAIAGHVAKQTNRTFWSNHIGVGCAVASIFAFDQPVVSMFLPSAILMLQGWISRMETRKLRHEFNTMASAVSPAAVNALRPIHNALPTQNPFTLADFDYKKHPVRVFGGLVAGLLSPPLGLIWVTSDILAKESSMNSAVKKVANDVKSRYDQPGVMTPR